MSKGCVPLCSVCDKDPNCQGACRLGMFLNRDDTSTSTTQLKYWNAFKKWNNYNRPFYFRSSLLPFLRMEKFGNNGETAVEQEAKE